MDWALRKRSSGGENEGREEKKCNEVDGRVSEKDEGCEI